MTLVQSVDDDGNQPPCTHESPLGLEPPLTMKITPLPFCFTGFQISIVRAIPNLCL